VLLSIAGLLIADFFYLAAVIHYALECQLIMFLMKGTADRIRSRCWAVDLAIKVSSNVQVRLNHQIIRHNLSLYLLTYQENGCTIVTML